MPILQYVPRDPTDLVLQGEQLRMSVEDRPVSVIGSVLGGGLAPDGLTAIVADEDAFAPMNSMIDGNRLTMRRSKNGELQMRDGAGIVSPCGAWIWLDYTPLLNPLLWAAQRWLLSGVTKDATGAPLGNCRVVVLETGRLAVCGAPVVAETISDGSGNYAVDVPMNTAYEAIAYKPGSPDVAGITRADVTPAANG